MSRTDKDAPHWVRALHAVQSGLPTNEYHSCHCLDRPGGLSPVNRVLRRVPRAEAEASGWAVVEWGPFLTGADHVYARVPHGPFPCDIDTGNGRCSRRVAELDSYSSLYGDKHRRRRENLGYYRPERAHVRDALRAAAADYNTHGGTDIEPIMRQTRGSTWTGTYWD